MRLKAGSLRGAAPSAAVVLALAAGTAVAQHGSDTGHLPPISKNMQVVSKLEPLSQGPVAEDQIGDLAVFKGFAYLMSGANCAAGDGGFYKVDIRDPASPGQLGFTAALAGSYHSDAHAITMSTASFAGDLLAVNNRTCLGGTAGGFDLYDVSNPANPVPLTQGFGDGAPANEVRALAVWDAGAQSYAATIDAEEAEGLDIFEITNPASPQLVREYSVSSDFPEAMTDNANLGDLSQHGAVSVRQVGDRFKLLFAHGDDGYIQLDAQDPANLQYDADSDFGGTDPLTGFNPPEGNANHVERSADNRYLLTAERDSRPFRVEELEIDDVGTREARIVPEGTAPNYLEDGVMNGPAAYVGYACDGSAAVPSPATVGMPAKDPGEEWIAVAQRGPSNDTGEDYNMNGNLTDDACLPGEKVQNAVDAGWDAVLIANRHIDGGAPNDGANCGSSPFADPTAVAVCTTHAALHELFDDAVTYTVPYDDNTEGVAVGTQTLHKVLVEGVFDGYGYVSLYDTTPDGGGKLPLLDAFAVSEALNPAFAFGFGDLSAEEQATDPTEPLSYTAYNSAGVRVFSFESGSLSEQGAFIDQDGNDIAGVEQFTTAGGERLIAASDRDMGLYVLRYTGPLGPRPPACSGASAALSQGGSATIPLACSDPNGNTITRRIVSGPAQGTLGPIDQGAGSVTYTHTGAPGSDSFTFAADDGAASSSPATATIQVAPQVCCALPFDLQSLTIRPSRFRAFGRGGSVRGSAVRRGARVRYRVSKAARASFSVTRIRKGRRPVRLRRTFTHAGKAGANAFTFTGRLGGAKLRPGRYRLTVRATDATGARSRTLAAPFRIVR